MVELVFHWKFKSRQVYLLYQISFSDKWGPVKSNITTKQNKGVSSKNNHQKRRILLLIFSLRSDSIELTRNTIIYLTHTHRYTIEYYGTVYQQRWVYHTGIHIHMYHYISFNFSVCLVLCTTFIIEKHF